LKAVIFDMDGVIIDSEPAHHEVCKKMFRELDINMTDEEYLTRYIGTSNTDMWGMIKEKYLIQESIQELVIRQTEGCLKQLKESNEVPIHGVRELLEELRDKRIKIGLASSSAMETINVILDKFNISSYFSAVVSGENLEKSKPDPTIFLVAAKLLSVNPNECLVIEDSSHGVTAAKKAGMKCIGFRNPNSGSQDISHADLIVDSIQSIDINKLLLEG
jgi:beta-phosphoglucomutase family hydrolase